MAPGETLRRRRRQPPIDPPSASYILPAHPSVQLALARVTETLCTTAAVAARLWCDGCTCAQAKDLPLSVSLSSCCSGLPVCRRSRELPEIGPCWGRCHCSDLETIQSITTRNSHYSGTIKKYVAMVLLPTAITNMILFLAAVINVVNRRYELIFKGG